MRLSCCGYFGIVEPDLPSCDKLRQHSLTAKRNRNCPSRLRTESNADHVHFAFPLFAGALPNGNQRSLPWDTLRWSVRVIRVIRGHFRFSLGKACSRTKV